MIDLCIKGATAVLAIVGAIFALRNMQITVRTKTSEFLLALHKSFFTDETYRTIRCLLDDSSESAREKVAAKISEEADDLICFLNFFEMVSYMWKTDALSYSDVDALLGYYLKIVSANVDLKRYIEAKEKSFEHLNALLNERQRAGGGAKRG